MPDTSYGAGAADAMPDSGEPTRGSWIELEGHRRAGEAVSRWLARSDGFESFRVSGAAGVGKSSWLADFMARTQRAASPGGPRLRWVCARFRKGEPVEPESLVRQWSEHLARWVERPARYARGADARQWLDLAVRTLQAEGCAVVRTIESDRERLGPGQKLDGLTECVLWLAREPFRGSRATERSVVLPVWSHDELTWVLSRRHPEMAWTDELVSRIWAQSRGHARAALRLARGLAREGRATGRSTATWPLAGMADRFEFPAA